MSAKMNLTWVNKSRESSSLSNSRNEKDTCRRIRSHALVAGHKSSRVRRPIKRVPLNLRWHQITTHTTPLDNLPLPSPQQQYGYTASSLLHKVAHYDSHDHSSTADQQRDSPANRGEIEFLNHGGDLRGPLSTLDPFSCCSVDLDATKLDCLWYFGNIWTQCAFKIPGCIGYGQESIEESVVTAMIQQCLSDETRFCSMLAATSARMQYIHHHHQTTIPSTGRPVHTYAATALRGVRQAMQKSNKFSEDDSINALFLATYEIFCSNGSGAEKHLAAVRRLYPREISNRFVQKLQLNLELLVYGTVDTNWLQAVDLLVQSR